MFRSWASCTANVVGADLEIIIPTPIARERPVILVADAEDTAREMYMKQGYTFVSFQYSALKELTVSVSY